MAATLYLSLNVGCAAKAIDEAAAVNNKQAQVVFSNDFTLFPFSNRLLLTYWKAKMHMQVLDNQISSSTIADDSSTSTEVLRCVVYGAPGNLAASLCLYFVCHYFPRLTIFRPAT